MLFRHRVSVRLVRRNTCFSKHRFCVSCRDYILISAPGELGACLREYLFSEAFIGLGLQVAVAVSVCTTGEAAVIRDPDPNNDGSLIRAPRAILCRTAPSFIRFGSFELPARRGEVDVVRRLADYCIRHLGCHLQLHKGNFPEGFEPWKTRQPTVPLDTAFQNSSLIAQVHAPGPADDELLHVKVGRTEGSENFRQDYLKLLTAVCKVRRSCYSASSRPLVYST